MKVIVYTEFDMFTYKAVGAAVGLLIYAILAYKFPQFDLLVACLIAFLIGSLTWYFLYFILIKRNGLCIEFRYSKKWPRLASVTLSKRFKQLDYMVYELPASVSGNNKEFGGQIHSRLKELLTRNLSDINKYEVIQFVGCSVKDVIEIREILKK